MGGMGVRSKPMDQPTFVHGSSMGALRPPMPPRSGPLRRLEADIKAKLLASKVRNHLRRRAPRDEKLTPVA